eukprot:TRINITY_DN10753_c0_g2_i1.p2 TRINITY_DN10753_c0_g2~~TRINITY_DN10753_c0_g2_i1.p2  ORF type:complete len:320 (+),score=62.17 TRINITY_DN10753_c0_g2_i1:52-960(+)
MAHYQLSPEVKTEIDRLALEAGKAAHMLRNYTQGMVSLKHPEVATCDNMAGQIEGQLRALRAHVKEDHEFKPLLNESSRAAVFLTRIMGEDFIRDKHVDAGRMTKIRDLLQVVASRLRMIDYRIQEALVKGSEDIFGESDIHIPMKPMLSPDDFVATHFNPELVTDLTSPKVTTDERQAAIVQIASALSNKAHEIQDIASPYIISPYTKDVANHLIGQCGGFENEARKSIAYFTVNKANVAAPIQKCFTGMSKNISCLKDYVEEPSFNLNEVKSQVTACINELSKMTEMTLNLLSKEVTVAR